MRSMSWHIRLAPAIGLVLGLVAPTFGQDAPCLIGYEQALVIYERGDLREALEGLDTLRGQCTSDKEQLHRVLLLSAVAHLRIDSMADMGRDLEAMLRNDRNMELKPYENLIKDHPAVWSTFEEDVRVGFRKDHGRLRAGFSGGVVLPLLMLGDERRVFEADEPFMHSSKVGSEFAALLEYDVAHNIAIRLSGGISQQRYAVRNNAIDYEETLISVPLGFGIKKMFWLGEKSPWVPYLALGATYAPVMEARASISRSGDGVRFLSPKTLDRISERENDQVLGWGALGISYKVGHSVLFLEGQYSHALSELIPEEPSYSETELLTRYYYVDRPLTLSSIVVRAGLMYVVQYHKKNRLHP